VNPWDWSKAFGFSEAVVLSEADRVFLCSGQTAIGDDGAPPTTDDMSEQIRIAMANLTAVLKAADMDLSHVVKFTVFTTDVDELVSALGVSTVTRESQLAALSLIGVTRLAYPELKVEIEAIAAK
jgi:enamine deaminase RidA (YjgF/YER057c/UK114 family)